MDIYFTQHAIQRKAQRGDWLIRTPTRKEARSAVPALEELLRRKGRWFSREDPETEMIMFYCIVNNLEVYCGVIEGQHGQWKAVITTYYPYTSKMKKRLYLKRYENYEMFDIDAPEFDYGDS